VGRIIATVALVLSMAGCSLNPHDLESLDKPQVRSVEVTPVQVSVLAGSFLQFRATVIGDGTVPQVVNWGVRCVSGCDAYPFELDFGSVTAAGLYRAPSSNRRPLVVEVKATGVVPVGVTGGLVFSLPEGRATVQVSTSTFSVTPSTAAVVLGGQLQLHWERNGMADPPATWTCLSGTIDAAGHYLAPDTFSDPVNPGSYRTQDDLDLLVPGAGPALRVNVQLLFRTPVLTGVSGPGGPGSIIVLSGSNLAGELDGLATTHAVFSDGGGGEVSAPAVATSDLATVVVPSGAASGPLRVEIRANGSPPFVPTAVSNSVLFERPARLRLHADRVELTGGESTTLQAVVLGAPGPLPITYQTDLGTMAGRVYTAPATVTAAASANVRACLTGTSTCAGLSLALSPVRFEPGVALVAPGGVLQFSAQAGGVPAPFTYTLGVGGGAVTPEGRYLAPTALGDAGPAWLLASDGTTNWPVQVGVAGSVPGLLNRLLEPAPARTSDLTIGVPWGAAAQAVAVASGRAYVLQSPLVGGTQRWIDVFDLTDPARPAWLGAVEARDGGASRLRVAHGLLLLEVERQQPSQPTIRSVDAFELVGTLPVRVGAVQESYPAGTPAFPVVFDADALYIFGALSRTDTSVVLRTYQLTDGTFSAPSVNVLALPARNPAFDFLATGAVSAGRAYVTYHVSGDSLAAFDLSANPARLLGTMGTSYPWPFALVGRHLLLNVQCLDLVPELPVSIPCTTEWAEYAALARDGSRLVSAGLNLDDYSIPARPHRVATVEGGGAPGVLIGDVYLSPEGSGGLAIYDLGREGGARRLGAALDSTAFGQYPAFTTALRPPFLYAAGLGLSVWDLSSSPPAPRGTVPLSTYTFAAAASQDLLLLGTRTALQFWSLIDPGTPSMFGEFPLDVSTIEVDGTIAWVGTGLGELLAVSLLVPASPVIVGRLPLGATARAVRTLPGGRLAVALVTADWTSGDLVLVDGSNPTAPVLVGAAGLAAPTLDVALAGSIAAVVTPGALVTLDLAVPAGPTPLATVAIPPSAATDAYGNPDAAAHVTWSGALAWVTVSGGVNQPSWLGGFDLRLPRWPLLVSASSFADIGAIAGGLTVVGSNGYLVPGSTDRLTSLDLSQPRNVILTLPPPPRPGQLSPP
jgi:hypothetical protein